MNGILPAPSVLMPQAAFNASMSDDSAAAALRGLANRLNSVGPDLGEKPPRKRSHRQPLGGHPRIGVDRPRPYVEGDQQAHVLDDGGRLETIQERLRLIISEDAEATAEETDDCVQPGTSWTCKGTTR